MHAPGDDELQRQAERLGASLRDAKQMLVTAESCTGGWIAKAVTDVAGSSDWFDCGLAAYSYEAKQRLLGVRAETLEHFGAVSRETVLEMVSGALVHSGSTIAVAVTGIAGPGGGTDAKPVGTVAIAIDTPVGALVRTRRMLGGRDLIRAMAVHASLDLLRRLLTGRQVP